MVVKNDFIRARVERELKEHVHAIFCQMGVTPTQVVTMLYRHIERERRLPFDLSIPNKETAKAIREAKKGKGLIESKSLEDLFNELDI